MAKRKVKPTYVTVEERGFQVLIFRSKNGVTMGFHSTFVPTPNLEEAEAKGLWAATHVLGLARDEFHLSITPATQYSEVEQEAPHV